MSNIYFLSDVNSIDLNEVYFSRKLGSKDKQKRRKKLLIGGLAAAGTLGVLLGGHKILNVLEKRQQQKIFEKQFKEKFEPAIDNMKVELKKNREQFDNNINEAVNRKRGEHKDLFDYISNLDVNSAMNKIDRRSKLSQEGNLLSRGIKGSNTAETKALKSSIIKRRRNEITDQYNRNVKGIRVNETKRVDNLVNNLGKKGTNLTSRQRRKYNSVVKELSNKARINRTLGTGEYSKINNNVEFARSKGSKDTKKRAKRMGRFGAKARLGFSAGVGAIAGGAVGAGIGGAYGGKGLRNGLVLGSLLGAGTLLRGSYLEHKRSPYSPIGKTKWKDYKRPPRMYGIPTDRLDLIGENK